MKDQQSRILVIDLEATCDDDGGIATDEMEIIEIGACWATATGEVHDQFQSFVRPLLRPTLTPFCASLTGISQIDVDTARPFAEVAFDLNKFACLYASSERYWTSWGAYDRKQIERDCLRHSIPSPIPMPHFNAKRRFAKAQRIGKEVGMAKALELAGIPLLGAHHRALDDARNIARLLPWILGERTLKLRRAS